MLKMATQVVILRAASSMYAPVLANIGGWGLKNVTKTFFNGILGNWPHRDCQFAIHQCAP